MIKLNKTLFVLAAATSLSLASAPAFSEDGSRKVETKIEQDADGSFVKKTTVKDVDADGTATTDETEVKVKVDDDGSYKKTVDSKATKDPKGLMNKSSVSSSETIKSDDGEYTGKSVVKTKNGETGTATKRQGDIEVKTDVNGNIIERNIQSKVIKDPKGLGNKETVKTVDKIETGAGGTSSSHKKVVNGETVEDSEYDSGN